MTLTSEHTTGFTHNGDYWSTTIKFMKDDIQNTMKDYLGDSVYAEWDGWHIILTTNNGYHDDPRNTIALEPCVMEALKNFEQRVIEHCVELRKQQTEGETT